jgi:hypothetical protein
MGKMGDTWRGVEISTKTGETDEGVTKKCSFMLVNLGFKDNL